MRLKDVVRSFAIMISYTDMQGIQHTGFLEDFIAAIFQHETDHLLGIVLIDRIRED